MSDYQNFLATKHVRVQYSGHRFEPHQLNRHLRDWQAAVDCWWLKVGRPGGFEDCGLGKTLQQLAFADALIRYGYAKRALILAPPAVAQQTLAEAVKFQIEADCRVVRHGREVDSGINITNYERLHLFDAKDFEIVVLDESSILKSYIGKTKQELLKLFKDTRYRLACTATPAPNDHMELGNHAEFLGVMRANEMMMRWFINDTMHTGNYRLKGHAEADFWRWMASWAVSASKPSDLGDYSDEGYELPPLNIQEHVLGDEKLFADDSRLSATAQHKAKRARAAAWADRVSQLVNEKPEEPWVCWCDTNYEADELRNCLPDAVEVRGSDQLEAKEEALLAFTNGQIKRLITKAKIAGFGMNWQHCANTTCPVNDSYERFYQMLRRLYRFGQLRTVNCHIVLSPEELAIARNVQAKSAAHEVMKSKMSESMKEFQSDNLRERVTLQVAPPLRKEYGEGWTLHHGDCVESARQMRDDSIDFTIHSPPFSNLYIYSDSLADMGNAKDHDEFFKHYEFLIEQLYRVTVPGRLCAVHCKDLPLYKGRDGAAGLFDFPGLITRSFERFGWVFHSRVTIWKDPVTEMQRTHNHGLLHRQLCKDSSASRQGMADYLLVFRKWNDDAEFPQPVTTGNPYCRFTRYVGDEGPEAEPVDADRLADGLIELTEPDRHSIQVWQRYASPVWFDIRQMRVLNYRLGRDDKDEKHICPLQLDVIERAIELWTNPSDLVFDPFNGIGSSGYVALKAGRRYVGSELKQSYFDQSVTNLLAAIEERKAEARKPRLLPGFDVADDVDMSLATAV